MSRLWHGLRGISPVGRDRALAAFLLVTGEAELITHGADRGSLLLNGLAVAGIALPFAWRRRHTLAVTVVVVAFVLSMQTFLTTADELFVPFLAAMLLGYSGGAYAAGRTGLLCLAILLGAILTVSATAETQVVGDYIFPTSFGLIWWLAGRAVRTRTELTAELHEEAVRAQEAREAEGARAAAEERRRIAREMHDVVAHSVSVMVVQAGGARRILDRDPARAIEAAGQIERTGREALAEMRRLLGVLHPDDEPAARAPQPTLANVDALVERAREAGLPVSLTVQGEPLTLPPGVDLAAYRVVQEALTNALKHAGTAPTEVHVRWSASHLELEILDRGPAGSEARWGQESGHGLVGMRERVRLYGGELETGRRRGGGFRVHARLPLVRDDASVEAVA
jgi:signal transduction histidine kinase